MDLQLEQQVVSCYCPAVHRNAEERFFADGVVPDSLPDAAELLLTEGTLCLWRLDLTDGAAELEGEIASHVCCMDENGAPMSFSVRVPVLLRMRADSFSSGSRPFLRCQVKDLRGHLLNSRKVRVQGTVQCLLTTYAPSELSAAVNMGSGERGLHIRKSSVCCSVISAVEEQLFTVEDTAPLRLGVPGGGSFLSSTSMPVVEQCECREHCVQVSGNVITNLLYLDAESNEIVSETIHTPFSRVMDLNSDAASCRASVFLTSAEIHCGNDVPEAEAAFHLVVQIVCCHELEMECVADAYSNQGELILEWKNEAAYRSFSQEQEIAAEFEMECDTEGKTVRAVRAQNLGGSIAIAVLLQDEANKISCVTESVKTETTPDSILTFRLPSAEIVKSGLKLLLPYSVLTESEEKETIRSVSSAVLETSQKKPTFGVTLVRREELLDLWNLAKENASSVEIIQQANPERDPPFRWVLIPHER